LISREGEPSRERKGGWEQASKKDEWGKGKRAERPEGRKGTERKRDSTSKRFSQTKRWTGGKAESDQSRKGGWGVGRRMKEQK
jgi:hypothetical protein